MERRWSAMLQRAARDVENTMNFHLMVSLRNVHGMELRSMSVDFAPRQIL
jgi:hypothetical protein